MSINALNPKLIHLKPNYCSPKRIRSDKNNVNINHNVHILISPKQKHVLSGHDAMKSKLVGARKTIYHSYVVCSYMYVNPWKRNVQHKQNKNMYTNGVQQ